MQLKEKWNVLMLVVLGILGGGCTTLPGVNTKLSLDEKEDVNPEDQIDTQIKTKNTVVDLHYEATAGELRLPGNPLVSEDGISQKLQAGVSWKYDNSDINVSSFLDYRMLNDGGNNSRVGGSVSVDIGNVSTKLLGFSEEPSNLATFKLDALYAADDTTFGIHYFNTNPKTSDQLQGLFDSKGPLDYVGASIKFPEILGSTPTLVYNRALDGDASRTKLNAKGKVGNIDYVLDTILCNTGDEIPGPGWLVDLSMPLCSNLNGNGVSVYVNGYGDRDGEINDGFGSVERANVGIKFPVRDTNSSLSIGAGIDPEGETYAAFSFTTALLQNRSTKSKGLSR